MNYLFYQLTRSFGIFFRTIRAFFVRQATAVTTRVRQMTNLSRNAMLVAAHSVRHHKKITQNTKRLICRVDIILIHLSYHSYICNRKCPHIRLLIFLPKNSLLPHSGV